MCLVERKEATREWIEAQTVVRFSAEGGAALLTPLLVPFKCGFSRSEFSETGIAVGYG